MSTPLIEDLVARYFDAPNTTEQERVLRELGGIGGDPSAPNPEWVAATRALIELLHLTIHPRERVRVLRGFKACLDRPFVVPALLGELDDSDPAVVLAAVEALGHVGVHYAGAAISNWLEGTELETMPTDVLEAALLSLAQIGWPEAGDRVLDAWEQGLIDPQVLHLALAEAVDDRMVSAAIDHLAVPEIAPAAALHLSMVQHPEVAEHLQAHLTDASPELSLLFHQMMEPRRGRSGKDNPPADLLLDAVYQTHPTRRRRLARRLRAMDVNAVVEGFEEVAELVDLSDGEDDEPVTSDLIQAAMAAGIPELQDAVLKRYASDEAALRQALRRLHSPTAHADRMLPEWIRHDSRSVAVDAARARFNAFGADAADELDHLKSDARDHMRVEWVRLQQNAWMLRRNHRNRIPVDHETRQRLVAGLRDILRSTETERIQEHMLALYVIGNLDLNELSHVLVPTVQTSDAPVLRLAAANSMGELELPALITTYPELIEQEQDPEVLFRIMRSAHRSLLNTTDTHPDIATATLSCLDRELPPRTLLMALKLLGVCRDEQALDVLRKWAAESRHAFAAAAITALGHLGSSRAMAELIDASKHPDDERRICAATAFGRVGGDIAQHRLLDMLDFEGDLPVRSACLAGLQSCGVAPSLADRLTVTSPDDPLALGIIQLRLQSAPGRASMSADEIDQTLEKDIPGFDTAALSALSPDALESFRTAQHLFVVHTELPTGFDAAGSVLLWNKALELWLNRLLKKHLLAHTDLVAFQTIEDLENSWYSLRGKLAPGWKDTLLNPKAGDLWDGLARTFTRALRSRTGVAQRSQSLSVLATALLISAGPTPVDGFERWSIGLSADKVQLLGNRLVALARQRNRLTHEEAGDTKTSERVRSMAIECAVLISQMKVKPPTGRRRR